MHTACAKRLDPAFWPLRISYLTRIIEVSREDILAPIDDCSSHTRSYESCKVGESPVRGSVLLLNDARTPISPNPVSGQLPDSRPSTKETIKAVCRECNGDVSPSYNLIALRFAHQSLGASVPSDHLDTEMMNSVIGCGEY